MEHSLAELTERLMVALSGLRMVDSMVAMWDKRMAAQSVVPMAETKAYLWVVLKGHCLVAHSAESMVAMKVDWWDSCWAENSVVYLVDWKAVKLAASLDESSVVSMEQSWVALLVA